jgi:spore photoproduct lyase
VERAVADHPRTQRIISRLPGATVVQIETYKHIFNRPKQNFELQKKSPKLILAAKQPPFTYPFSANCPQAEFNRAVYVTPALGCRFDCDFCFLHGMYNSANLVVFVNTEDVFNALDRMESDEQSPLLTSISYETDLLAMEPICGFTEEWIDFSRNHANIMFECRTRSGQFKRISEIPPSPNFLLSWSLNPQQVITQLEHGAPSLDHRLQAAKEAMAAGWHVRLCFDPVVPIPQWQIEYRVLFEKVFASLEGDKLYDVTTGPFRMGKDFFKRIRRHRPWCDLFYKEMKIGSERFNDDIITPLSEYISREKLIIWESQS